MSPQALADPSTASTATAHSVTADVKSPIGPSAELLAAVAQTASQQRATSQPTTYTVKSGDTLSGIAEHYYHEAADWQWLYHENDKTISDPNLIYPGETLFVPADPPANFTISDYVPKHAKPAAPKAVTTVSHSESDSGSHSGNAVLQSASKGSGKAAHHASSSLSGTLGCSGLEDLWDAAGGNPSHAFMAAEIAMAESGGDQYALSPTDDFGYWQINASNGSLATYNALGNARSAIILSDNGTNWSPWTTYTAGLYYGRC